MENLRKYITDGVTILLGSATAYLAAYLYELGYARHFCIPSEFVQVDVRSLLLFGATIFGFGWLIYQITNLVILVRGPFGSAAEPSGYMLLVRKHIALILAALVFWLVEGYYPSDIIRILPWILFYVGLDLLAAALGSKRDGGIEPALRKWIRSERKQETPGLLNTVKSDTAQSIFLVGCVLLLVLSFSLVAGLGEARRKGEFPIDRNNRVLLRRYGDTVVFGYLDIGHDRLLPVVSREEILSVTEQFELVHMGPLKATEAKETAKAQEPTPPAVTPTASNAVAPPSGAGHR
jgi:hypothetical protein